MCGAESGDQESLDVIDKDMDVEDNYKFAEKCRKYGIKDIDGKQPRDWKDMMGSPHTYFVPD